MLGKNEVVKFVYTWMDLETLMVSEMNLRERDRQNDHTPLWDIKIVCKASTISKDNKQEDQENHGGKLATNSEGVQMIGQRSGHYDNDSWK